MKLYEGDVVTLPVGLYVRADMVGKERVIALEKEQRCIVESTWQAASGSEDDHFTECDLASCRLLNQDGSYNQENARYIIATSGDFEARYILKDPVVENQKFKRAYVKVG